MPRVLTDEQMTALEAEGKAKPLSLPQFKQDRPKRTFSDSEMDALEKSGQAKAIDLSEPGGVGQTFLENYGNTALFGYLPHLQAGVERFLPNPNQEADEKLKAQGFKISQPEFNYTQSRDTNAKRIQSESKENPKAAIAGTVAGLASTLLLPGGAVAKGATLGEKALSGAKIGTTVGLLANPGDNEGAVDPFQVEERLRNAALGATVGAAGTALAEITAKYGKKTADYFRSLANEKATKALGPGKKDFGLLQSTGQDQTIGRELLDQGAVPILGTPKRIAGRVENLKEAAGKEIGDLISKVGDQKVIDGADLGVKLLENPKIAEFRKTPGFESLAQVYDQFAETLASRGKINLKEAQELRQLVDKSINFNKKIPEMRGKQEALYDVRTLIRNQMNDVVNALSGAPADALETANQKFSNLQKASDILDKKIAGDASNRTISLTDTIAAGAATTGNPLLAAALGLGNKAIRTFGNSVSARTADAAASLFNKTPSLSAFAQQNPLLFQVATSELGRKNETKGESKINRILSNAQVVDIFRNNPVLIENIKDPELKSSLKRAIGSQK